ncbi:MAG: FUSC family protein [Corynebacterium sp.]|nr:FUSC family protein [Corynebacterium sp.]
MKGIDGLAHDGLVSTRERLHAVESSLKSRALRVKARFPYIVQATLGAALAYWVAHEVFGHAQPFFAPMSVVIILGLSGGDRLSRSFEMALGGICGVAVGDTLFHYTGSGWFQILLTVFVALLVGSFLTKAVLVSNQIVIGSILIATILPPDVSNAGLERAIDALIGSVIGIVAIALIPTSPLTNGRVEVSKVLAIISSVLHDVARALDNKDPESVEQALAAIHGSQSDISSMLAAVKTGKETTKVSPLMWGSRRRVRSFERMSQPVANGVRTVQVMARRAAVLTQDGDEVPAQLIDIIEKLSDVSLALSATYQKKPRYSEAQEIPILIHQLRELAAQTGPEILPDNAVLSAYAILAQTRSAIVDLLIVCGMSRESAVAQLKPSSAHPAFPPESL